MLSFTKPFVWCCFAFDGGRNATIPTEASQVRKDYPTGSEHTQILIVGLGPRIVKFKWDEV